MGLKNWLLDLLFPVHCLNCQKESTWLCEKCFRRLEFTDKKYFLDTPNLTEIFIAGDYDNPLLRKLIKHLKFNNLELIGPILARFLVNFWTSITFFKKELLNTEKIIIIPIPLSKKRQRLRGFNQAELLARPFSQTFGYALNLNLKRSKHCSPQSALGEEERRENIKDVFVWPGASLAGKNVLLIDDVVTTGATLNEAARVLKLAGAKSISALVLAKG